MHQKLLKLYRLACCIGLRRESVGWRESVGFLDIPEVETLILVILALN